MQEAVAGAAGERWVRYAARCAGDPMHAARWLISRDNPAIVEDMMTLLEGLPTDEARRLLAAYGHQITPYTRRFGDGLVDLREKRCE